MPGMMEIMVDAFMDSVKLLPFLLVTYIVMEYMEHRMGERAKGAIGRAGRFGAFWGAVFGVFPQCGFSAAASNLFAGRVISLGTLLAIYLSTSDEMLPILISEQVDIGVIFALLGMKALIGMAAGFLVDLFIRRSGKGAVRGMPSAEGEIGDGGSGEICGHGHCCCEEGIFRPAVRHTVQVFLFIFVCSLVLNFIIGAAGEDFLAGLILDGPVTGHLIAGAVGLIPNCAASVLITQLYLEGYMRLGVMMSGLLVSSGVGVLVLFRVNDDRKENVRIVLLLYAVGVTAGILLDLAGVAV